MPPRRQPTKNKWTCRTSVDTGNTAYCGALLSKLRGFSYCCAAVITRAQSKAVYRAMILRVLTYVLSTAPVDTLISEIYSAQ